MAPVLLAAVLFASPAQADLRARGTVLDLTVTAQAETQSESPNPAVIAIVERIVPEISVAGISALITQAAMNTGVPADFLLRLLKRESNLNPTAVSPKGALGIAQFMPATAAERGLADPFDPVQAIPKAAELLRDLRQRYGSWALAAAAYNAGPGRVDAWLLGRLELPKETVDYVVNITGVDTLSSAAVYRPAQSGGPLQIASFAASLPLFAVASEGSALRASDRRETSAEAKRAAKSADGVTAPLTTAQLRAAAGGILRPAAGLSPPCAALLNSTAPCLNLSRY